MKFIFLCTLWLLSLKNGFSLLKVLDDTGTNCTGLICEYSIITWKEKIEILQANNELRNIIADGYSADITTAAINKLAWSEKLSVLAQEQANQCPGSKVWSYTEKNGQCEFASAKRTRKYLRFQKNFSSFVDENRMMDTEEDPDRTKRKLRRGSAYSIGCGFALRYHRDKLIDHFVCLYCYVNNKHDYISFNGNRSCQQDCLYQNFTCDRIYSRLCSYEGKDGNIDSRHKSNPSCPKMNLLTGSVLFWNFLGNNTICMLAAIFIFASVVFSLGLAVYFSVKNYDNWKKYFTGKNVADEPQAPSIAASTMLPKVPSPSPTPTPPVAPAVAPTMPPVTSAVPRISRSPPMTSTVPPVTPKVPPVTSKMPSVSSKISRSPPMTSTVPSMTSKVPLVTSEVPLVASKVPLVTSKVSAVTSKVPPVTSKVPLVTSKVPPVTSTVPSVASTTLPTTLAPRAPRAPPAAALPTAPKTFPTTSTANTMASATPIIARPSIITPAALTQTIGSAARTVPFRHPPQMRSFKSFPPPGMPTAESRNLAKQPIKSNAAAAAGTSGHKVNNRMATRKMAAQGASQMSMEGVHVGRNRTSDPTYGRRDKGGTDGRTGTRCGARGSPRNKRG